MRTTSLLMGLCAAAALLGTSIQVQAAPVPAVEFTFASGDFTNTGSLGGVGTPAGFSWAAPIAVSAAGVNPYGSPTLQSLAVPNPGYQMQALGYADNGKFDVGNAGGASAMTLAMWVNLTTLGNGIAGHQNDNQQDGWSLYTTGGGYLKLNASGSATSTTHPIAAGTWEYIAFTWAPGTGAAFYVNGVDAGYSGAYPAPAIHAAPVTEPPLTIGYGDDYNCTGGNYAAIRVWDSALTAADISELYASETAPIPEPTSLGLLGVAGLIGLRRRRA